MAVKEDQSPEMIGVVFRTVRAVVLDGAKFIKGQVNNENVAKRLGRSIMFLFCF